MHGRSALFILTLTSAILFSCGRVSQPQSTQPTPSTSLGEHAPLQSATSAAANDPIVRYFSARTYDASVRKYTVEDIRAPRELIASLTNRSISFLALLRNEISARHGYDFQSDYLNQTLEQTSWYRYNPAFVPETGLTGFEEANVKFLKRMEEIDAAYSGRQLAVVLNFPKEQLTTDEALKVWAATGDTNILTSVSNEELVDTMRGGKLLTLLTVSNINQSSLTHNQYINSIRYLEYNQIKMYLLFHLNDRLLMRVNGNYLLQECVYENTNVKWLYRTEEDVSDTGIVPSIGLAGISSNGDPIFTNLIYDPIGYGGTQTVRELERNGYRRFYTDTILTNSIQYFELATDYRGYGRVEIYFKGTLLWCFRVFGANLIETEYLIKEVGRSLYVMIPFTDKVYVDYYGDDIYGYQAMARANHFRSGVKVFKITVLN